MRDLRLIGVHDDGEHLVVTDDSTGEEYRLRIDEPLRAAARRDRPRLGQLQIAIDNNVRPREVQAMIRAGADADEVSARTGWDLDKIARFEGPVLAEREHVAERAQAVRMRGTHSGHQETLGDRARARFAGRGVESSSVQWDARRGGDGQWTVSATFSAGGRERIATWWFDVPGMSVVAKNDEAKWLSEADAPAGPVPAAVHRPTAVFDVEVEESRAERAQRADPDELIASMREHSGARGRRRGGRKRNRGGDTSAPDDALPFDTGDERPPAARGPHANDDDQDDAAEDAAARTAPDREAPSTQAPDPSGETGEPAPTPAATEEAPPTGETSGSPTTAESTGRSASATGTGRDESDPDEAEARTARPGAAPGAPSRGGEPSADRDEADQDEVDEEPTPKDRETHGDTTDESDSDRSSDKKSKSGRGRGRKGRASVPSWDDVMFGTTRD